MFKHLLSCSVQVACAHHLREVTRKEVAGRAKLGVAAFAEALLGVPKTLAENSGYDAQVGAPRGCSRAALKHSPSGSHTRIGCTLATMRWRPFPKHTVVLYSSVARLTLTN